jgi:asparagine synthase (glutamine-hydrolysing)
MNKKGNFIISVSKEESEFKSSSYNSLPNRHDLKTGNSFISIKYSNNTVIAKSSDDNIIILLSGNIYPDDLTSEISTEQYLLNKYSKHKKDFVKYLNGSFCMFFAQKDTGDLYFATDRLNTRKIFKFEKGNSLLLSTDINFLPLDKCKLSYAGAASYLINGIMLNDLTVFEEIKKLERSSLHLVNDFRIVSRKYWDYNFTNEYEHRSERELADELHQLYLKSLKKIIKGKKDIYISLSGGYDSRGIAAMMKNAADTNANISCISHNFGEKIENTDSDTAWQIAESLGYPFRLLNSYNGDLFHTFKKNAELGSGMTSFCMELDAWDKINKELERSENSIFLVGDMYDGTYVAFHGNTKRALEKAHICEPSFLNEYKNFFTAEVYRNLYENWGNEYDKIINKISSFNNMVNMLDYLYMDQLIPNLYSVERESFHMPFIETASPFYDNEVLDFIQKIPPQLRDRKKLHKLTLETYYPEIFRISFPSAGWGIEPVWANEIRSFSSIFIENINNHKSKLDEFMSPIAIVDSILSINNKKDKVYKGRSVLKSFHNSLNKILPAYHRIVEILPWGKEITRKAGKFIHPRISHPLIKILILRLYLAGKDNESL